MRPSARFVRAVTAERADLERQREHLAREAADLRAALARIEAGMVAIDEQCGLLERLVPAGEHASGANGPGSASGAGGPGGADGAGGPGGADGAGGPGGADGAGGPGGA